MTTEIHINRIEYRNNNFIIRFYDAFDMWECFETDSFGDHCVYEYSKREIAVVLKSWREDGN